MQLSIKFINAAISVFLISMAFFLIAESSYAAQKKDNDNKGDPYVMTEIQLQSWLMSFSDRFATVLINSFERFEELGSTPKIRRYVLRDTVYAIASALTIASEPNPETALLDMVTLTTLARIIYEDNRTRFGEPIEEMILGFRNLETDIWGIAAQILTKEQQSELRRIIMEWRKSHPNQKYFSHLRFSEFGTKRHDSKLVKKGETGGLFKSVQKATQQVEELRMLAERGMFLGSRLPILAGMFGDVWASRLIQNPGIKEILDDIHKLAVASERLTSVMESLPDDIAKERKSAMKEVDTFSQQTLDRVMAKVEIEREAAIKQFAAELSKEREKIFDDFVAEEKRIRSVLTELRQTLSSGNELMLTTNTLLEKFNIATTSDIPSEPFDINDYRATIVEVANASREINTMVNSINQLIASDGLEQLLPKIVKAVDQAGKEGDEIIDHAFIRAIALILIGLAGYVVARLIIHFITKQRGQPNVSNQ